MAIWPAVYRLKAGRYFEASKQFPELYESEVLPSLDKKVAKAREGVAKRLATRHDLAVATMARDRVLRVTGRDPVVGLGEAREWMRNPDPQLRRDAAAVFGDIGGQTEELRALTADRDLAVSRAARFALSHGADSIGRFNSAVVPGPSGREGKL